MLSRMAPLVLSIALLACTKNDPPTTTVPSAAPDPTPSAAAPATASASASAATADPAPSASAAASSEPAPSASAAASAPAAHSTAGGATPAASASAAAAPECGKKPLPDCPLQGWMKKNMNPPMAAQDLPALAAALEQAAKLGPPGYGNWASLANDGAKAAKAGDLAAAKASCRTCHDQYKQKYKDQHRTRKI
jgi:hypothetical protein